MHIRRNKSLLLHVLQWHEENFLVQLLCISFVFDTLLILLFIIDALRFLTVYLSYECFFYYVVCGILHCFTYNKAKRTCCWFGSESAYCHNCLSVFFSFKQQYKV